MERVEKSVGHVEGYIRNTCLARKHNIAAYIVFVSAKIFIRGRIIYISKPGSLNHTMLIILKVDCKREALLKSMSVAL